MKEKYKKNLQFKREPFKQKDSKAEMKERMKKRWNEKYLKKNVNSFLQYLHIRKSVLPTFTENASCLFRAFTVCITHFYVCQKNGST